MNLARLPLVLSIVATLASPLPAYSQTPVVDPGSAVYRSVAPSVFLIQMLDEAGEQTGIGSAFLIEGGKLVTNAHVVARGEPFLRTGAVRVPLEIERLDKENDLAVLISAMPLDAEPLSLGDAPPEIGSTVYALGNPRGFERTISQGLLSGERELRGRRFLQVTAPMSPGSSGGPIVNSRGVVIGVARGYMEGAQNLNFAVPVDRVRALLGDRSTEPTPTEVAQAFFDAIGDGRWSEPPPARAALGSVIDGEWAAVVYRDNPAILDRLAMDPTHPAPYRVLMLRRTPNGWRLAEDFDVIGHGTALRDPVAIP